MYTIEKANLIAEQLRRFTSNHAYHLAGQAPNIDFWLNEAKEALKTIDGYNSRFNKLRDSQQKWIDDHGTIVDEFCPICQGKCELSNGKSKPSKPKRKASSELKIVRRNLKDNAYNFLIRCYNIGLLTLPELEIKCSVIGSSVDPSELK